jgi:hypothetical protein
MSDVVEKIYAICSSPRWALPHGAVLPDLGPADPRRSYGRAHPFRRPPAAGLPFAVSTLLLWPLLELPYSTFLHVGFWRSVTNTDPV